MTNIGSDADSVYLIFNGKATRIFTSYSVRKSILTQPSQFNVRLGWGKVAKDLIKEVPPNTPFRLYINDKVQQTGFTDGFKVSGKAAEVEIHGRDVMARIHDPYVEQEIAFRDDTYVSLTNKVLQKLGFGEAVLSTNANNRKLTTGIGIVEQAPPSQIDTIELADGTEIALDPQAQPTSRVIHRSIQAKVGERYGDMLKRQYDRAGLFLWATGDGEFVLSEPNKAQPACARIVRGRGQSRNTVTATDASYRNDTTHRFERASVFAKGGGGKNGRLNAFATETDEEMRDQYAIHRVISFRDVNVSTKQQGEFYARRKLAEAARAGWQLTYTVPGHTAPSLLDSNKAMVWQPDTMVEVQDDEFGIHGKFYVEEVVFSRPPTQTILTLMRPEHLIFGSDDTGPPGV